MWIQSNSELEFKKIKHGFSLGWKEAHSKSVMSSIVVLLPYLTQRIIKLFYAENSFKANKEGEKKKEDLNGFSWLSHSAMGENCGTYKSTLPIPFV